MYEVRSDTVCVDLWVLFLLNSLPLVALLGKIHSEGKIPSEMLSARTVFGSRMGSLPTTVLSAT